MFFRQHIEGGMALPAAVLRRRLSRATYVVSVFETPGVGDAKLVRKCHVR